jgi:ureidoglycolate lyase
VLLGHRKLVFRRATFLDDRETRMSPYAIAIEPLTKSGFEAFGQVIEAATATGLIINEGFAHRFNDLAAIDVGAMEGTAQICLFEAEPRSAPIRIRMMERHPLGSQLFLPLQDRPWLVVVCADPANHMSYRAFLATGRQGVSYRRNVWHHPLLVLDPSSRFVVVDRKGSGNNLEEVWLDKLMPTQLQVEPIQPK